MTNHEQVGMPLPQWQSHKKVWGDKIVRVSGDPENEVAFIGDTGYRWHLACGAVVMVDEKLLVRVPDGGNPVGGYYVQYADGFRSWSPAQAFEEGYTLID